MHPDSKLPSQSQQMRLCDMLHHALVNIRMLAGSGCGEQASDLADAFHNLPHEIWCDYFSVSYFRDAFLMAYISKWNDGRIYLEMLDEIEKLK